MKCTVGTLGVFLGRALRDIIEVVAVGTLGVSVGINRCLDLKALGE